MNPHKETKKSVGYQLAKKDRKRCGICKHFDQHNGCRKVLGIIQPGGWCRLWESPAK